MPPGQGRAATRARNLRKRIRKKELQKAAGKVQSETGSSRPKSSQDLPKVPVRAAEQTAGDAKDVLPAAQADQSISLSVSTILPTSAPQSIAAPLSTTSTPVPMSESQREDLKMLSLASGNSKKAKSLRRDLLNGRRQTNKKIVYTDGDAMSMDVTPDSSAILADVSSVDTNSSTAVSTAAASTKKLQNFFPNGVTKRPPPPPPSTRSDLPSNVIVTSVDVEAEDFVPGVPVPNFVAPPQIPYSAHPQSATRSKQKKSLPEVVPSTQRAPSPKAALDASEYFNAYSGYYGSLGSRGKANNKKQNGTDRAPNGETTPANLEKHVARLDTAGWPGWPTVEQLESGMFESFQKVTAPGDGEKVAVKVSTVKRLHPNPSHSMPIKLAFVDTGALAVIVHAYIVSLLWYCPVTGVVTA